MDKINCLDTYILVEIVKGNPKFSIYIKNSFIIPDWILGEFYYVLLREYSEEIAEYWLKKIENNSIQVSKEIIIKAMKFRYHHKKKNKTSNISFFDAVGYIFSKENNCFFVTGDKEFKNLEDVEFVKK